MLYSNFTKLKTFNKNLIALGISSVLIAPAFSVTLSTATQVLEGEPANDWVVVDDNYLGGDPFNTHFVIGYQNALLFPANYREIKITNRGRIDVKNAFIKENAGTNVNLSDFRQYGSIKAKHLIDGKFNFSPIVVNVGAINVSDTLGINTTGQNKIINEGTIRVGRWDNSVQIKENKGLIMVGNQIYSTQTTDRFIVNGKAENDYNVNLDTDLSGGIINAKKIITTNGNVSISSGGISGAINGTLDLSKLAPNTQYNVNISGEYNGSALLDDNTILLGGTGGSISFDGIVNSDLIFKAINPSNITNNHIVISSGTTVNGNIDGGNVADVTTVTFGSHTNIFNEVKNIKSLESASYEVRVHETAKLTNVKDINIKTGDLYVEVNMNNKDLNDKYDYGNQKGMPVVVVNSFKDNVGTIKTTGGKLIIDAFPTEAIQDSIGKIIAMGQVISFGKTNLDDSLWVQERPNDPSTDKVSAFVGAKHALIDVSKVPNTTNKVFIHSFTELPTIFPKPHQPVVDVPNCGPGQTPDGNGGCMPDHNAGEDGDTSIPKPTLPQDYNEYNEIYQAHKEAGRFAEWEKTSKLEQVYWTLEQIYSANPYAYTMKSAVNNLKLFKNNVDYATVKPKAGERLSSVRMIYTGDVTDNYASGKGHYSEQNLKTSTNTVGVVISNEYGLTDTRSVGVAVGYARGDTTFKSMSNVKSDNLYAGVFFKNQMGNLHTKVGVDYQYTTSKVKHNIVNAQDSFNNKGSVNNNTISVNFEGKYDFPITESFTVAPVLNTAFYRVFQDQVNEGQGRFASKVNATGINLVDVGAGLDFGFKTSTFNGSLKQILHVGVEGTFGDNEKTIYASFIPTATGSANRYGIKTGYIPKVSGQVGYKLEFEALNNFIYSFGGNYEIGKNVQNFDANLGLGYKF